MKLEIKHIAPYLPYGLKFEHVEYDYSDKVNHNIAKMESLSADCITFEDCSDYYFDADNCDGYNPTVVPILRPMSDLYKEIDGVVGIVELFEMYETRVFDKDKKYSIVFDTPIISYEWAVYDTIKKEEGILKYIRKTGNMGDLVHSFRYDPELRRFSMYDDSNRRPLAIAYQIDLFTYLFSHHYDVFGLIDKGLAIDINSLNNGKSL